MSNDSRSPSTKQAPLRAATTLHVVNSVTKLKHRIHRNVLSSRNVVELTRNLF